MRISSASQSHGVDFTAAKCVPILDIIGPLVALKKQGSEHLGLCPFHTEKTPSFSVSVAKNFYHCFGCGANGDGTDFIQNLFGIEPREAVEKILGHAGFTDPIERQRLVRQATAAQEKREREQEAEDAWKARLANKLFTEAGPVAGTLGDHYLRHERAISNPLPSHKVRFGYTKNPANGLILPTLFGAICEWPSRDVWSIHQIFLNEHGKKNTGLDSPKLTLGKRRGGAIRLGPDAEQIGVAEGLETALSVAELYGGTIWARCGSDFHNIILPDITRRVVIYSDNGTAGQNAAERAAEIFHSQGRKVTISRPIDGYDDFNTYLQAQAEGRAA